jgi:recombination protein RecA
VYGVGIDRMLEIMEMASEFEILRKYGKTITYGETKYPVDEFRSLLEDNEEFFDKLRQDIIDKINQTELPVEEETIKETEDEDSI